jgi:RNA polymerase sigma-70 factor (ECF subfamily)
LSTPITITELQNRIALYEDMKAYKALYDLLSASLHRFSITIVKSKEVAEEIVSDVFIKIWQIRDRLPEIDNLKVYLYTITKNFSLNYIQRNYKNSSISIDALDLEPVISYGNPEELCISAEIVNRFRVAINQLPPQCRLIFQLVKEDGLKYKEAAEVLNISVFTVRNQLAIAVHKLAQALPAYMQNKVLDKFSVS